MAFEVLHTQEPLPPARLGVITQLDTSENAPVYLLECQGGVQFRLSEFARSVLELRWNGDSFEQIALRLHASGIADHSPEHVHAYYQALVDMIEKRTARGTETTAGYFLKRDVIPSRIVERVAGYLTLAFTQPFAMISAVGIAIALIAFFTADRTAQRETAAPDFVVAYLLFFLSLIVHEFGHAAAAVRFGRRPGPIGFTLYLTFPALFSDVSHAWSLKRWQRVVIDGGGSYLQLIVMAGYIALYAGTHWAPLHIAVLMILGVTLFNLNPIFKFDGYWIVADLLGVTNLSQQSTRLLRAAWSAIVTGRKRATLWPRGVLAFLLLYVAIALLAWTAFVVRLLFGIEHGLAAYGGTVMALIENRVAVTSQLVVHLVISGLGLALAMFVTLRLAIPLARHVGKLRPAVLRSTSKASER